MTNKEIASNIPLYQHGELIVKDIEIALDEAEKRGMERAAKIASHEYGDALGEGCDGNGAWDCAIEAIHEAIKEK